MSSEAIYNYIKVSDDLITGGQPTVDQVRSVALEGITTVINLAPEDPRRSLKDEAGIVRSLGMRYVHIPVEWSNPQESDFEAFERAMTELPAGKTFIHCMANFRVTAFYGLYAQKHLGWSEAQAEELRKPIWSGSNHPIWEQFIVQIRSQITTR